MGHIQPGELWHVLCVGSEPLQSYMGLSKVSHPYVAIVGSDTPDLHDLS